jgi:glutamyl-tRNA synthetase
VRRLLEGGHAYRCFCTRERLDEMRAENRDRKAFPGYDRRCREIPAGESSRRAASGEVHVVRMKVPVSGECIMRDHLRGEIHKEWELVDDQVILKSDGFPTYHLANVVDDHLMGITHVIRGEEWINSVPKHLLLYEYFGWQPPVFCHLPLLRNNDPAKSKLSKRKNPTSINYYRRAGFLPEAMLNFMGLMGWQRADGEEKFTLEDFVRNFRIENVSLGGPVFDIQKLRWLNGRYIRENYDARGVRILLERWALSPEMLERIIPLAQPRLETLSDWGYLTAFYFADAIPLNPDELRLKGKTREELLAIMQIAIWRLEQVRNFTGSALEEVFRDLSEKFGLKLRDLTRPFYVAIAAPKHRHPSSSQWRYWEATSRACACGARSKRWAESRPSRQKRSRSFTISTTVRRSDGDPESRRLLAVGVGIGIAVGIGNLNCDLPIGLGVRVDRRSIPISTPIPIPTPRVALARPAVWGKSVAGSFPRQ